MSVRFGMALAVPSAERRTSRFNPMAAAARSKGRESSFPTLSEGMPVDAIHVVIEITAVVCYILVMIRMFFNGHFILGILSLPCICPLVAFVYGWIRSGDWNMRGLMMIWTIALIANVVLYNIQPPSYIPMERLQL